jgi:hypothetical protein
MVNSSEWVEFFGAPGVGKSTLFKEVIKKMPKDWFTEQQAIFKSKSILGTGNVLKCFFYRKLYSIPLTASFLTKIDDPINHRDLLSNFIKDFPVFYKLSLDTIFNSSSTSYRKTTAFLQLFESIKMRTLIRESNLVIKVLSDESLCQRMFTQLSEEDINEVQFVRSYFKNIPFDGRLIYVKLNEEEIVLRIQKRYKQTKKLNYMNTGLSQEELLNQTKKYVNYVEIGVKTLELKGISVLHIDNSLSVDTNSNKIVNFLNKNHN